MSSDCKETNLTTNKKMTADIIIEVHPTHSHLLMVAVSNDYIATKLMMEVPFAKRKGRSINITMPKEIYMLDKVLQCIDKKTFPNLEVTLTINKNVEAWYEDEAAKEDKLLAIKNSVVTNGLVFNVVNMGKLYPYQRQGAVFLANSIGAILADEPGLGKTLQALYACELVMCKKVLIICPKSVKGQWAYHIKQWLHKDCLDVDRDTDIRDVTNGLRDNIKYFIIHTEMLRNLKSLFHPMSAHEWDVIIVDEAHKLKNSKSQQSKGMGLLKAKRKFLLTGTPIMNKSDDLWNLLNIVKPASFNSYWDFVQRYCIFEETPWGKKVIGNSKHTIGELKERLDPIIIRREKKDVIASLPDKMKNVISYTLDKTTDKIYKQLRNNMILETDTMEQHYDNTLTALMDLRKLLNMPGKFDDTLKCNKDEVLLDLVENLLEYHQQIIIFTWFTEYAEYIKKLLEKTFDGIIARFIHSKLDTNDRDSIIKKFQEIKIDVLVGTLGTLGTGLNLQNCSCMIFADLDWTPSLITQAEDRIHRIGQDKIPEYYYIIGQDTIEEHIYNVVQTKQEISDQILAVRDVYKQEVEASR
jgi:SNF2 family DNA or RNA helicase